MANNSMLTAGGTRWHDRHSVSNAGYAYVDTGKAEADNHVRMGRTKTMDKKNLDHLVPLPSVTSLAALFRERVKISAEKTAYIQFDDTAGKWLQYTWRATAEMVARWQQAMRDTGLEKGDRVALMMRNSWQWVLFDQAALGLGLVVVPIYTNDRAENIGYILQDAQVRLLFLESDEQWRSLTPIQDQLAGLTRVVTLQPVHSDFPKPRIETLEEWLPEAGLDYPLRADDSDIDELATIVYTSGTTGRPKGVMLSHRNLLFDVYAAADRVTAYPDDRFLSFLPLSHMFERTACYYMAIATGAEVSFNRSVPQLGDDLVSEKPTLIISVPRIFEKVYAKITDKVAHDSPLKQKLFNAATEIGWEHFQYRRGQAPWSPRLLLFPLLDKLVGSKVRAKLGGHLKYAVCGGAALSFDVAKLFIGLGVPIIQGYGLTETSPIITGNLPEDNDPASVGPPLKGIEVKLGENDELLTRSPAVMLGYLNNPEATAQLIDKDGWLHTGDVARIDADSGRVYITGRIKDILVLSNGEKIPPGDMETAVALDELFDQILIVGEGRPYLAALVVLEPNVYREFAREHGCPEDMLDACEDERVIQAVLDRVQKRLHAFPGYAKIQRIAVIPEQWTIENNMMTPTLKLKRARIEAKHADLIEALYAGH